MKFDKTLEEQLAELFNIGYIINLDLSEKYLNYIIDSLQTRVEIIDDINTPYKTLLPQIIDDSLKRNNTSEVLIPLSGGLDSRCLLGACLEVLPAKSIHAVTMGDKSNIDFKKASIACKNVNVEHIRIEPRDIKWTLKDHVDIARNHFIKTKAFCVERLLRMGVSLASFEHENTSVLSGYFGTVSGNLLPIIEREIISNKNFHLISDLVVANFLKKNFGIHDSPFNLNKLCISRMIEELTIRFDIKPYQAFTVFDIADFGLRQACFIKPNVTGFYEKVITPFDHPLWLSYWLNGPIINRLGKKAYKEGLTSTFKEIFFELQSSNMSLGEKKYGIYEYMNMVKKKASRLKGKLFELSFLEVNKKNSNPSATGIQQK